MLDDKVTVKRMKIQEDNQAKCLGKTAHSTVQIMKTQENL